MAQYSNWRLTQYGQRRLLGTVGAGTVNPETSTTGTNIEIRGLSIGTGYDSSTINPEEYYETRKSLRDPIHTYSVLNYYGDGRVSISYLSLIQFPLKRRLIHSHFWIFFFPSSFLTTYKKKNNIGLHYMKQASLLIIRLGLC